MLTDAKLYSEHRSLQDTDSRILFESVVRRMDWSRPEQDVVMDIGCGAGEFCRQTLLANYREVGKIVGIDISPDMIGLARRNNAHEEKIEFHVASIEDRDSIGKWYGEISKIVSVCCFNWLEDQPESFRNVFRLLKPGGEAGLVFVLQTPFWDSYELHYKNPRWSEYLKNCKSRVPESHFKKHGAPYYRSMLQDIGFTIKRCDEEKRIHIYRDDSDCRDALYPTALTSYIPDELKAEFGEDLFKGYLKYSERSSDGRPTLYYNSLTLHIQKPAV